jgi:outer membrane protein
MLIRKLSFSLFLTLVVQQAMANDQSLGLEEDSPGWLVGMGYLVAADPFVGDPEDASQVVPLVGYVGERLTWLGPHLSYRVSNSDWLYTSLVAEVRFAGFDSDSSDPALAGLDERKSTVEVGFDAGVGPLWIYARQDVGGIHKGSSFGIALGQDFQLTDRLIVEASVNGEWQDKKLLQYYYGVDENEVTEGRPVYAPGSGFNVGTDIKISYQLAPRLSIFFDAQYQLLDEEISDSPIVDKNDQYAFYVGFTYQLFD